MHYVDEGLGEPIVFLHGMPTWSFMYRQIIRGLSIDHRCVAPDMIGFGLSDKPANWTYRPEDQVRNLAVLMDQLGLENVTLVMHDYGVSVGTAYAIEHPERIKRLVVMNGVAWDVKDDPNSNQQAQLAAGFFGKMMLTAVNRWPKLMRRTFGDHSKFTEAFEASIAGPTHHREGRIGLWKTAKALSSSGPFFEWVWDRRRVLDKLPIQFIWGMKDPVFGAGILQKWLRDFPLSHVERLPSAGHFPSEENAMLVLDVIRCFIAKTNAEALHP